jgi:hypothetical protein
MERVTGTHSESRLSPTLTSQDSRSRSASRSRKKSRCRRWHTYGGRKTSAKTGLSKMELPSSYQIELPTIWGLEQVEMTPPCEHGARNMIELKGIVLRVLFVLHALYCLTFPTHTFYPFQIGQQWFFSFLVKLWGRFNVNACEKYMIKLKGNCVADVVRSVCWLLFLVVK